MASTTAKRRVIDRWILSEVNLTTKGVRSALDRYMSYEAAMLLIELAENLSNWYVRFPARSRR